MSMRLARIQKEYDDVRNGFDTHPFITVMPNGGSPPESYKIIYAINGVERIAQKRPVTRNRHEVEIRLPVRYPKEAPVVTINTPIFHPNFSKTHVCIGDHWAAQERVIHLISRVGEMIAYQSYNPRSPLNAEAARWCETNDGRGGLFPIDRRSIDPVEADAQSAAHSESTPEIIFKDSKTTAERNQEGATRNLQDLDSLRIIFKPPPPPQ